ncbi:MAG: AAA family ATPase [Methanolinea sp. SDB]|nr:MAG: AAA family ATPase [Methanolinea sp. SDB]
MKHEMAMTKNVKRFLAAVRELNDRSLGVEGMGLLWGLPGEGKSTTVSYATNTLDGVYLRALDSWTVTSMLADLIRELDLPKMHRRAPMVHAVVESLLERPRPLFIDEADYLLRQAGMIDTLRDIYDLTGAPVVLIGMEDMARKVQKRGKFARRITQWIEFSGIDLADTRETAKTICEVGIADDLIEHLHRKASANIGRMVTGMARIESFGRTNGLATVTLADWADRQLFYDQPRFSRRG